jgi:hypothetical protein
VADEGTDPVTSKAITKHWVLIFACGDQVVLRAGGSCVQGGRKTKVGNGPRVSFMSVSIALFRRWKLGILPWHVKGTVCVVLDVMTLLSSCLLKAKSAILAVLGWCWVGGDVYGGVELRVWSLCRNS